MTFYYPVFFRYPERLQSLLIPTLFLLDSNSVYVQFAALKVLKRLIFIIIGQNYNFWRYYV